MNAKRSGDPALSTSKWESQWRWFKMLLFLKVLGMLGKWKATCIFNLSTMQLQSKQHAISI
jgi:hypothetical protein